MIKVLDLPEKLIADGVLAARIDLTLDFLSKAHGFPVADVSAQFDHREGRNLGQSFEVNGHHFSLLQNKTAVAPAHNQTEVLCSFKGGSASIQKTLIEIFRNLAGFTPDKITWLRPGLNQDAINNSLTPAPV